MEKAIINPWLKLIEEINNPNFDNNHVLRQEQSIVEEFNEKINNDLYKIHTQIMPSPFMGDVYNASVVILMLNPGYDPKEDIISDEDGLNYYNRYKDWWKKEIQHIHTKPNLPFFALDEQYSKSSDYWVKKLKPLTSISTNEKVARDICTIQFFSYHSQKYKSIHKKLIKEAGFDNYLPSQKYNFQLVKDAISRNAIIIIARSKKIWFEAIPELAKYENLHFTNSYLNTIISKNNLPSAFPKILEKLK